jgi:hypothetical protein
LFSSLNGSGVELAHAALDRLLGYSGTDPKPQQ